jgi:hypothetical protein
MKISRNLLLCLAGVLAATATSRADDAGLAGNPYAIVAARNIFGLNPPKPVDPHAGDEVNPPPKITLNGITDILGELQVLFKVANPAKGSKPAADQDYMLSEGQSQDDIEVVMINQQAGIVTFKNHGETQDLTLVAATPSSGPAPAATRSFSGNSAPGFRAAPGGLPVPTGNAFNGGTVQNFGGNYNRGMGNSPGNNPGFGGNNNAGGPVFGASSIQTPGYHVDGPPVDPAVQAVVMEATREQYKNTGEVDPQILPRTALSSDDESENQGTQPGPQN